MLRALAFFASVAVWAAPCTTATPDCTEWLNLGGGPARAMVYRSHPLAVKNAHISRALIMIHGQGRNADDYFRTAVAAAFLAGALQDTLVISPRFSSNSGQGCADRLAPNEVNWRCSGNSWRSGAAAVNNDRLTSYDFTDEILRKLADKSVFPALRAIVVAGHSAGGQYVARYAMANQVHDQLGVPVSYVVSNPSSYAYLDGSRPSAPGNCAAYDQWPFGLQNRTGYTARLTVDQIRKQLAARPVVYLLSELDTLPLAGFDSSCQAMVQGPHRLARGQAYHRYVNGRYGAHHALTVVPMCGHNARCVFTADQALPVLFPKP